MMTIKLNARDLRALNIIRNGGRAVSALRRNFHGAEQQAYWIVDATGAKVPGLGFKTIMNLCDAGLLARDGGVWFGSTCRREWIAA